MTVRCGWKIPSRGQLHGTTRLAKWCWTFFFFFSILIGKSLWNSFLVYSCFDNCIWTCICFIFSILRKITTFSIKKCSVRERRARQDSIQNARSKNHKTTKHNGHTARVTLRRAASVTETLEPYIFRWCIHTARVPQRLACSVKESLKYMF